MAEEDGVRWDDRHARIGPPADGAVGPPRILAPHQHLFPTSGVGLEVACGQGRAAVWLSQRGLRVLGFDVSPVAVGQARDLAGRCGVADRCRFEVVDLDDGLPEGPPVDVVVCHMFRDPRLDRALIERLAPGGLLAIAVLSEVDADPGPFRARPGELRRAFGQLEVMAEGERRGEAWLLAKA